MSRHAAQQAEIQVEPPAELENQFILRLPVDAARTLREAIRSGAVNLKDRLTIRFEPDMRYGELRFDHWVLYAKLVDLPTIIESLKTIDNKSFYKTADICQMLLCTEEEEQPVSAEEDTSKQKKKDPNKVDKKFLWPHGITPPMKNVRRKRFRKTLKKKYVEAPEIEKEVKRLLRVDNEAVDVRFEIISEDTPNTTVENNDTNISVTTEDETTPVKHRNISSNAGTSSSLVADDSLEISNQQSADVNEHEIFGEAVSDSDAESSTDDDDLRRIRTLNVEDDDDENSRLMVSAGEELSNDNSRSESNSMLTQFSREMFQSKPGSSLSSSPTEQRYLQSSIRDRIAAIEHDLSELRARKERDLQDLNVNVALRERVSTMIDNMITAKQQERDQLYLQLN